MGVLLVATFPIVLMFNSQMAWLGISVGILLLYLDRRRDARAQAVPSAGPARATAKPRIRTPQHAKRPRPPARSRTHTFGLPSRA